MIRIADGFLNSKVNAQSVKTYVCHQIQVRRPLTAEKRVQDLRNETKAVDNTLWGYIIEKGYPLGVLWFRRQSFTIPPAGKYPRCAQDHEHMKERDKMTGKNTENQSEIQAVPTGPETDRENGCCCISRHKVRSEKEYRDLMNRLSRIEGQVRGIRRMLEDDAYCIDILTQVSAANAALNSFSKTLLANHIRTCVAEDVREGHEEKLDELLKVLPRLMK